MNTLEKATVASVMRTLYSESVRVSWRVGDGFRHTRKGEWDEIQAVLERAARTLQALLEDDASTDQ